MMTYDEAVKLFSEYLDDPNSDTTPQGFVNFLTTLVNDPDEHELMREYVHKFIRSPEFRWTTGPGDPNRPDVLEMRPIVLN